MRLLVCAGRHFHDSRLLESELSRLHAQHPLTVIVHGGHTTLGPAIEAWARANLVHAIRYPANWQHLGKRAEGVRNAFMLDDSRPDGLLALPGGRHTQDLVARAQARGIAVIRAGDTETLADEEDDRAGRRDACASTPVDHESLAALH